MTIIAYDPKTRSIACDSMFHDESRRFYANKFRMVGKNKLALFAGDNRLGNRAFDLLEAGEPLTQAILEACSIVVFNTKSGVCYEYETLKPQRVKRIEAWGSGADFAIGSLATGADAEYAVKVACAHNMKCGGKVHVFRSTHADASRVGTGSVPVRQDSNDVCDAGERREGTGE